MKKADRFQQSAANARKSMGSELELEAPIAVQQVDDGGRYNGVTKAKNFADIQVDRIVRDEHQPREEFDPDSLNRLAMSLRTRGQLQPIAVRWDPERDIYVIIAGERRWRGAKLAGMTTIRAEIVEGKLDPDDLLARQLVENALREDLKPVEQAKAYRRLMDSNGWSTRQLADELSIAQSAVSQAMSLLRLPPVVQDQVEQGDLSPATAYEVSKIPDPEEQVAVAAQVVAGSINRDQVRTVAKSRRSGRGEKREIKFRSGPFVFTAQGPVEDEDALWAAWREVLSRQGGSAAA